MRAQHLLILAAISAVATIGCETATKLALEAATNPSTIKFAKEKYAEHKAKKAAAAAAEQSGEIEPVSGRTSVAHQ